MFLIFIRLDDRLGWLVNCVDAKAHIFLSVSVIGDWMTGGLIG